jgi:glycosyltransferase involved in cell wall biosynthesis
MSRRPPRFTIVLPLHNGGPYLRELVDSVLAQSYGDFAFDVLENASTDGSAEWLAGVRDQRVRVWAEPGKLGLVENFRRVGTLPRGEFLLFLSHDDRLDPDYLAIVDDLIRRFPDATLYTTHHRLVDESGRLVRSCRPIPARETVAELLAARLTNRRDMTLMGTVMRSSAYDAVGGIPALEGGAHADDALWLTLLDGPGSWKATAPDEAFSYRLQRGSVFYTQPWRSAVTGIEQYAAFVEALGRARADVREVWRAHAQAFLEQRYRVVILFALADAGARGLDANDLEAILASLDRLSPAAARRMRRRGWFRIVSGAHALRLAAPLRVCARAYWRYRPWR